MSPLDALAAILRAEGGLLAAAVVEPDGATASFGARAAEGPRGAGREAELALVVEAVREGYLLHYAPAAEVRVIRTDDPDLALLAGDRLYALGLSRLADAGDLESVTALTNVIALCAQAHAEGRPEDADAAWEDAVAAIGWGGARA